MAAMRECGMCEFAATWKCQECMTLVCPEHVENVVVPKGRKEGFIVLPTCVECTPEAKQLRREIEQQCETARGEEDRNNRLALLDQVIADPTTPLDQRAKAHLKVTFIKYELYIALLIVCIVGFGLLLFAFWAIMCIGFAIDGSESFEFYDCGGKPIDRLLGFL